MKKIDLLFNNTTATYKYFWFLSIIDKVRLENKTKITFDELVIDIISKAWDLIQKHDLNFGQADSFKAQIEELEDTLSISKDINTQKLKTLLKQRKEAIKPILKIFTLNVPYRFLSPWIRFETNEQVKRDSKLNLNNPIYQIENEEIEIYPDWVSYIKSNSYDLKRYTINQLSLFLETRNKNIPNIEEKLIHTLLIEQEEILKVAESNQIICPFCSISNDIKIIYETTNTLSFYDIYPVSNGHTLIIPKQHIENYFTIEEKLQMELWQSVNKVKKILDNLYKPQGYNTGINIGKAAGQSIFHTHIHLIPRYQNDCQNPLGGVRGVIAEKQKY